MADKPIMIPEDPIMLRFRGDYDYDGLLPVIRGFFSKQRFQIREPKFKYKGGGGGAEVEFKFESDRKVTHYIMVSLVVIGHFWDVVHGPKNTGKLEITIQGKAVTNYSEGFEVNDAASAKASHKWMKEFLDNPGSGLQFGDNKMNGEKYVEKMVAALQKEIKKHLKMECI